MNCQHELDGGEVAYEAIDQLLEQLAERRIANNGEMLGALVSHVAALIAESNAPELLLRKAVDALERGVRAALVDRAAASGERPS